MQKLPHPLQRAQYWQTKIRRFFQIYIFFVYYICFTFHIIFPSKFCPAILVFSYCFVFKSNCEHSTDCIFVKKKQFQKHGSCKAKGQFTCMDSNPEPAMGNNLRHWTKKSSPINVSARKFSILTISVLLESFNIARTSQTDKFIILLLCIKEIQIIHRLLIPYPMPKKF